MPHKRKTRMVGAYIVVVGVAHLETTVPCFGRDMVREDILEGMTALPLPLASSGVTVHWVRRGEVVPGTNETHSLNGRCGLAVAKVVSS